MRIVRFRRLAPIVLVVAMVGGTAFITRPYVHGLSFVIRAADMQGPARRAADADTAAITERLIEVPTRRGPMRARVYAPAGAAHRAALLTSGLHPAGIDEPRLVALARQLAGSGMAVVTPDIPELSHFAITPAITDAIEDAGGWLADAAGLAPDHKVALMGISFSGGLSAIAAGRPSLTNRVAFVFAFGGHDDLPRVLRYLCTGVEPRPGGTRVRLVARASGDRAPDVPANAAFVRPPHDYGVAVMLLGVADRLVPASQVEPLRDGIRRYLWASHLDRVDKPQADRDFAELRLVAKRMPEPSRTLLGYINDRDVAHLGHRLLPYVPFYGGDPALSVSRSPKPSAPVFLLHGVDDNVIPPVESEYLAEDLRGHAPVRLLLSGLISHAEADRPVHVDDVLQLAGFWGDLLAR
jgi:dienelactone hydrolase